MLSGDKLIPLIYSPRSLNEALSLLNTHPTAEIYAGGTARFQDSIDAHLKMGRVILSLHQIDELRKITHWERNVDLGAALTLNQLTFTGKNAISPLLRRAVMQIGNTGLRNLATLGGNICQKGHFGDLFPILYSLGASFEFRSLRSSRWVTASQASEEQELQALPGEILTRIRLPLESWEKSFYERVGHFRTPWDERISMVCMAKVNDDVLGHFRLCFFLPQTGIVRNRKMEAELSGQKLPLGPKERESVMAAIKGAIDELPRAPTSFQRERITQMTRWILTQLQED